MKQNKTKVGDMGTFVCIDPQILEKLPTNCIDCPLCKHHKHEEVDDWYMRRCVLTGFDATYPGVNMMCPLILVGGVVREICVDSYWMLPGKRYMKTDEQENE